jgi:hypothetical protein
MLVALMVGFLAMGLIFAWLLVHRFRVAWLEYQSERIDLDVALAARRAEATGEVGDGAGPPPGTTTGTSGTTDTTGVTA